MAVIVTRAGKGSPLTNNEVDANFVNLNNEVGTKAAAGANADITSLTGITGGISTADYLDIDTAATPAGAVGRLKWSPTEAGPEVGMGGGNVTLQLGQEELVYVLNKTGTAFVDMQVVRVVGAQGNRLEVALAQANGESTSATSLAVVTEPIANNAQGFATRGGLINDVDTSAFAEGSALWLSPTPGGITTTKPTAPNHLVLIGWCVRSHATVGKIFVHIQNGYELDELHDVLITSKANADLLQYDSTATVWKNVAPATVTVGKATNVAGGTANQILYNTGADTTSFIPAPTVDGTSLKWTTAGGFSWGSGGGGGQFFGNATVKAVAYNSNTIAENVTITAGNNGLTAGPVDIATGYAVTIEPGATWTVF
jgi:hypothetical protein